MIQISVSHLRFLFCMKKNANYNIDASTKTLPDVGPSICLANDTLTADKGKTGQEHPSS